MESRIITLTTDFGTESTYVAELKGVLLSISPAVRLVDISHSIKPQNIYQAAFFLAQVTDSFPAQTIHLAVVDPGVGSGRGIVYAQIAKQQYIAPDNGLLSCLAVRTVPSKIVTVTNRNYWLPRVSATFHGRDIMAPVAAHVSLGLDPGLLGPGQESLVQISWEEACCLDGRIEGKVISVDPFGNLITNITAEMLQGVPVTDSVTVRCGGHETMGIFTTYSDQPEMTFIALIGSSEQLELAIVQDNASLMLGVCEDAPVTVVWQ